jgi:hypothetical protein
VGGGVGQETAPGSARFSPAAIPFHGGCQTRPVGGPGTTSHRCSPTVCVTFHMTDLPTAHLMLPQDGWLCLLVVQSLPAFRGG